ncbi:PDDEXK nuclease domain-containing protein [Flavobacterium sp.]|jgi:predicted nuclease of restriction endonuclease-like (RecB) superfamily|uniref:PDDEXK nuclease domain-containing protein n=1 Tax=Flavobacterium sp. TaxID=239 RepID=UPI0022C59C77|nr:PDDEXK nuclease domain-containing protein [Flavobacterium sp.]MCZ8229839.1 PDDEXK nuclease domain-containing protein [Flavobacterium sp.]
MSQLHHNISSDAYNEFLSDVATAVQEHRVQAIQSVQTISNQLYWTIGELIIKKQEEFGWGKSVILLLSQDLPQLIGEGVSWSPRNLQFMKQLVAEYSNVKPPVSHLENAKVKQPASHLEYVKKLVLATPWKHNILIIQKVKDPKARIFYLEQTIKNRYSNTVLLHQIKAGAYEYFISKPTQHNFAKALPEHFQEQARESIKSVYSLDFLDINKPVTEKALEKTMIGNIKRLMLELGYGFCFIGNQYRLSLGEKEYYIDLLFYHRIIKCLVAVELKVVEFEPEFVGKLDFYLQLLDEQLKQEDDKPSIGILLVPNKDHLEVEYTLRNANKPIGVSEYILSKQLPEEWIGKLPTAEEFQRIIISAKKQN